MATEKLPSLGRNLKLIRKVWGYDQKQLGTLLGFTNSVVSNVERSFSNPSFSFMTKLSDSCDIEIKRLLYVDIGKEEVPIKPIDSASVFTTQSISSISSENSLYDYRLLVNKVIELEKQVQNMLSDGRSE